MALRTITYNKDLFSFDFVVYFKNIFKGRVALDNQILYLNKDRLVILFLYILYYILNTNY